MRLSQALGKRGLGWISWRRRRRLEHRPEVLEALIEDLRETAPDHLAVTGDLTNLGLPGEVEAALGWLERLGPPGRVSLVPGNHDAYAGADALRRLAVWGAYMRSDPGDAAGGEEEAGFPFVRERGPVALVGVCSARPTPPLLATGRLGTTQRTRLEAVLSALGRRGLCRVILIHHPPVRAGQSRRRALDDADPLRRSLERVGAELVLHGHTHRTHLERIPGPHGPIPVTGVPSGTALSERPERLARYHVHRIVGCQAEAGPACSITTEVRVFDRGSRRFVHEGELTLSSAPA